MAALGSRDNPKVKRWKKLAGDGRYRRAEKRALIEGPRHSADATDPNAPFIEPPSKRLPSGIERNSECRASRADR